MLALFTMGPKSGQDADQGEGEESGMADRGDGEGAAKRRRADGGWMDFVKGIEESSLAFMSPRAKLRSWKGGAVNDENVSILEDASWVKGGDFSSYEQGDSGVTEEESSAARREENLGNSFMPTLIAPSMLFKVDSGLKAAAERSIYDDMDLGEDAPELEDVEEAEHSPATTPAQNFGSAQQPTGHGVQHPPMQNLQIPNRAPSGVSESESPSTDLDSSSDLDRSKRFMFANVRKDSSNANSGISDTRTPEKLSLSGKLHQMENLGDFIDDTEDAELAGQESPELNILQPTTDEQVQAVKEQLESFVQEEKPHAKKAEASSVPPSALKPAEKSASKVADVSAVKPAQPKGEISEVQ